LTLRAARTADLPALYDLLEQCFPEAPRSLFVEQTERDATFRLRHGRVAVADGRIVGYVRIFERRMLVRGVPVAAGGIGSVATHPDARESGVASAVMRDAIDEMRRGGFALSFLFTGITPFYERLGYRVVREPRIAADPAEAARLPLPSLYTVRPMTDGDIPRLLSIYRRASAGSTGSVVRTRRSWRDATHWLGERDGDGLVAERNGVPAAYLRSRCRTYGHQILEAEHLRGHELAIVSLLSMIGARAAEHGERLVALVPEGQALANTMRTLPSATVTTDVPYPMMMRIISLDALLGGLSRYLRTRAAGHPGPPLRLGLRAPGGQRAVVDVAKRAVTVRRNGAAYELDAAATLDALLGQRRAGRLARPMPAAEAVRRIDALLPETALRFWNSDRI